MAFAIRADFRLGYYQGRDSRGRAERVPTPLRLHAALVAAAHADPSQASPSTDAMHAIDWLEQHTPDAIELPRIASSTSEARAFRDKGVVEKDHVIRKAGEVATRISAVDGPVRWWWDDEPERVVVEACAALCNEVAYLGEVASPVRLSVEAAPTTPQQAYRRADGLSLRTVGLTYDTATAGRYDALQRQYASLSSEREPTASRDAYSTSESERPDPTIREGVLSALYSAPEPDISEAPWTRGVRLRVDFVTGTSSSPWHPQPAELTSWAVALHRAIARMIGVDAPAFVTGKYADGIARPANRLAIHIVPDPIGGASFVILLTPESEGEEAAIAESAIASLRSVYRRPGETLEVIGQEPIDALTFWPEPGVGMRRWWVPSPLAVAESRPQRSAGAAGSWTAADALMLSVGFAWRDAIAPRLVARTREDQYRGLVDAARRSDVRTVGSRRVHPVRPTDYVHKMSEHLTVTCLTGMLRMPRLMGDRQLAAIGQSRHLGGGLLTPLDVPEALHDQDGTPIWGLA